MNGIPRRPPAPRETPEAVILEDNGLSWTHRWDVRDVSSQPAEWRSRPRGSIKALQ